MATRRDERIAKNEVVFREVNERVRDLIPAEDGAVDFLCECGDENCVDQVRLTPDEYERVRRDPVQFFVKPGHEILDVEDVVEEHERFFLVRKHAEEQVIARRADPRR